MIETYEKYIIVMNHETKILIDLTHEFANKDTDKLEDILDTING